MSREIKFRAWYDGKPCETFALDGRGHWQVQTKGYRMLIPSGGFGSDSVTIEQYTGLKDANGVEVYEGDVVECQFSGKWQVVWSQKACAWMMEAQENGQGILSILASQGTMTVIGNVHQHPHLLEASDEPT